MNEDQLTLNFHESIAAFEEMTGMSICFHRLNSKYLLPPVCKLFKPYNNHRTEVCLFYKNAIQPLCNDSDCENLYNRCSADVEYFENKCHAGIREIIFPIFENNLLATVIYIGQYVWSKDDHPGVQIMTRSRLKQVVAVSRIFKGFIRDTVDVLSKMQYSAHDRRYEQIHNYVMHNLNYNPSVSDLASELQLSNSRTSHLVKELFDMSFSEFKEQKRLELAKGLLANTPAKIKWIADRCGFQDENYFSRYFKQKASQTPSEYRRHVN